MGGASELRRHSPFELNFQNVGCTGRVLEGGGANNVGGLKHRADWETQHLKLGNTGSSSRSSLLP